MSILSVALLITTCLVAQETTEVTIQVKKGGKVVKDTTYQFNDATQAKHAVKMMEMLSGVEDPEGDHVKVIKKRVKEGEDAQGEHVIVMKSGDGDSFDILIDEDIDSGDMKRKRVKVIVSDDEHATWHVDGKDLEQLEEDVYIISEDEDVKAELEEILEDHEGENVKVIVVKKKPKKR